MTDDFLLELEHVVAGYGRHVVLSDVQIRIQRGGFYGLLGANGSGKSTLLKTILGIIPPLKGALHFHEVEGRPVILGYVPQRETLDAVFLFSAFEVALMGACGHVGPGRRLGSSDKDFAWECLRKTGADDFAQKPFSELSGGQKQRVLIARALATRANFLLLDEPTAGIDAAATQAILELLQTLHQAGNLTLLMVNHDLPALRRYVKQIIWLRDGKVLQGPVEELLSRDKIEEILELGFR